MGVNHLNWGNIKNNSSESVQGMIDGVLGDLSRCGIGKKFLREISAAPMGKFSSGDIAPDTKIYCRRVNELRGELREAGSSDLERRIATIQFQCSVAFQFSNLVAGNELYARFEFFYKQMKSLECLPDGRYFVYWICACSTPEQRKTVYEDAVSLGVPVRRNFFSAWLSRVSSDEERAEVEELRGQ